MRTNKTIRWLLTAAATFSVICGIVSTSIAQEDFEAVVKRTQAEKPKFAERHQLLLTERYDMADRPAKGVATVIRNGGTGGTQATKSWL